MINPYLEGDFVPLSVEFTVTNLDVTGTVPEYLDGRYLRNGPNPIGEIDPEFYHWFLGDDMVHDIRIRDGRPMWYRNRWVRGPVAARALGQTPRGRHFGPSGRVDRRRRAWRGRSAPMGPCTAATAAITAGTAWAKAPQAHRGITMG